MFFTEKHFIIVFHVARLDNFSVISFASPSIYFLNAKHHIMVHHPSSYYTCGCTWLKSEEKEEARRLLFNPEEPRICFFRAREEPQKI